MPTCRSFSSLRPFLSVVFVVSVVSCAARADAQQPDAVGVRAQGMGGAFTAVADDATATWWNPAGLASGAYLSMLVEYGRTTDRDETHRGLALAFPALGLGYYRMTVSEIQPASSTGTSDASRQDPGTAGVRSVDVSQFGATVGQSIGGRFVVATTLKLLRAMGDSHGGLDVGAMAVFGVARVGAIVRNVSEPTFGAGDEALTLRRQVRVGASVTTLARSSLGGATLAIDADMRRVAGPEGDERRIAGGAEVWTPRRILGFRAGISGSTVGESRVSAGGGASVALRPGLFADLQATGGSDRSRRGWGAAFRVTF
jgi:hypothetical protein